MDISVLASVGSFVVSERVLKPKASVLLILGCILAYDLTTKTHDVASLRVYRGEFCFCVVSLYSLFLYKQTLFPNERINYYAARPWSLGLLLNDGSS